MEPLNDIDAKILQYIARHGSADMTAIKAHFRSIAAIEYRVKTLASPEYRYIPNTPISTPKPNSSYLHERTTSSVDEIGCAHVKHLGIYELTEFGQRALQNYTQAARTAQKELWLKNAWIPIIVSLVTTVTANYILPKLPQILQWIASILSKTSS